VSSPDPNLPVPLEPVWDHRTVQLFPIEGPFGKLAEAADELELDEMAEYVGKRLDDLDLTSVDEQLRLAPLIRWIKNLEQAAENETALAEPFMARAMRHKDRSEAYGKTAEVLRAQLARAVDALPGHRFRDDEFHVFLQRRSRVVFMGTCRAHSGDHFETPGCVDHEPSRTEVPSEFLRISVEPARKKAQEHLKSLSETPEGPFASPPPAWAKSVPWRTSAVIR
jgi:hypothetical protein